MHPDPLTHPSESYPLIHPSRPFIHAVVNLCIVPLIHSFFQIHPSKYSSLQLKARVPWVQSWTRERGSVCCRRGFQLAFRFFFGETEKSPFDFLDLVDVSMAPMPIIFFNFGPTTFIKACQGNANVFAKYCLGKFQHLGNRQLLKKHGKRVPDNPENMSYKFFKRSNTGSTS